MGEFNYTIKPREVVYKTVRYRSRLEATWAAFFDICGWRFDYEPETFRGWAPDFLLFGHEGSIWVEVKPIERFNEDVARKMVRNCPRSSDELLILGNSPFVEREYKDEWNCGCSSSAIGWLAENEEIGAYWELAAFGVPRHELDSSFDFCHGMGSWMGRMFNGHYLVDYSSKVQEIWANAKNRTSFSVSR